MIICARGSEGIPEKQVKEWRKFIPNYNNDGELNGEFEEVIIKPVCPHCLEMLEAPYKEDQNATQ